MYELVLVLLLIGALSIGCAGVAVWLIATGQAATIDGLFLFLSSLGFGAVWLYLSRYVWLRLKGLLESGSVQKEMVATDVKELGRKERPTEVTERTVEVGAFH